MQKLLRLVWLGNLEGFCLRPSDAGLDTHPPLEKGLSVTVGAATRFICFFPRLQEARMQRFKSTRNFMPRAIAVALLLACANTRAATFTVTTTNDSGPGSLREAIANASAGADLITFNIPG